MYQARGDQLSTYGDAVFWLSVTPYLLMSLLDCLADALTLDYPICYLVRSEETN